MGGTTYKFLIASLIFTAIIAGTFSMINIMKPVGVDMGAYNATFNRFEDIETETEEARSNIENAEAEQTNELGVLFGLLDSVVTIFKNIWNAFSSMTDIISGSVTHFGLPTWFTSMLIAILGTIIGLGLLGSWMKWNV